jgi:hypothetical protein
MSLFMRLMGLERCGRWMVEVLFYGVWRWVGVPVGGLMGVVNGRQGDTCRNAEHRTLCLSSWRKYVELLILCDLSNDLYGTDEVFNAGLGVRTIRCAAPPRWCYQ